AARGAERVHAPRPLWACDDLRPHRGGKRRMNPDWLAKYPKAAALLQQAADGAQADADLDYTPDGAAPDAWPPDPTWRDMITMADAQRAVNTVQSARAEALSLAERSPFRADAELDSMPDAAPWPSRDPATVALDALRW